MISVCVCVQQIWPRSAAVVASELDFVPLLRGKVASWPPCVYVLREDEEEVEGGFSFHRGTLSCCVCVCVKGKKIKREPSFYRGAIVVCHQEI